MALTFPSDEDEELFGFNADRRSLTEIFINRPETFTTIVVGKDKSGDTDSVQDAINSLPTATGGKVVIQEGEFKSGTTITLKDNIVIEGQGQSSIIQDRIDIGTSENVVLRDLTIDAESGLNNRIQMSTASNIKILDCWFKDSIGQTIFASGAGTGRMIRGCTFENIEIPINIVGTNFIITNNYMKDITGQAIILNGDDNILSNNIVIMDAGSVSANPRCLQLDGNNNVVQCNKFDGNSVAVDGIFLNPESDDNLFANNEITGCDEGIEMSNAGVDPEGNQFIGNDLRGNVVTIAETGTTNKISHNITA